jgi:hypothetical protein
MISKGQEILQTERVDLPHHLAGLSHLISCDAQGHIEHRLELAVKSLSANPLFVSFVAGPTGVWKIVRAEARIDHRLSPLIHQKHILSL